MARSLIFGTVLLSFVVGAEASDAGPERIAQQTKPAEKAAARQTIAKVIRLEATSPGRVFEGIGAVSAGGSTRLLPDYPEPQRSQVLDYLFTPKFGAGFQHLKVEIGGGENSTCGSEPSHVVTREELADPKPRGYEFQLMAEARKRNPRIILDCLPWSYPAWVGNRFSADSARWFAAFLEVARRRYGVGVDWVSAAQNEHGTDLNWIVEQLRPTLDAQGFGGVQLQAPDDDSDFWRVFDDLERNPAADRLISAAGYHYIDGREPWDIDQKAGRGPTAKALNSGKPLWASEEWSNCGGHWDKGALYVARLINKLYALHRATKVEIWCPVDSIYDQLPWGDTGVMRADTPWCGHYEVWPAVWAIAHTTQFAEPGWIYLDDACGQFEPQTWRGSHVALRDPKTGDWSLIACTAEPTRIRVVPGVGLRPGSIHLWKSTAKEQFVQLPPLEAKDGAYELELEGDAIYSLTSTQGQRKGSHGPSPERKAFPMPWSEDFEIYQPGETPRYFADQKGTFETYRYPGGGMCLKQIVPEQGILWPYVNDIPAPYTIFGDKDWRDYSIEADVLVAGASVELGGRCADQRKLGYRWVVTREGHWQLNWQDRLLASGRIAGFDPAAWHHLALEMVGDRIRASVDGKRLAEVLGPSQSQGMACLVSAYAPNLFDNISVRPATAAQAGP